MRNCTQIGRPKRLDVEHVSNRIGSSAPKVHLGGLGVVIYNTDSTLRIENDEKGYVKQRG